MQLIRLIIVAVALGALTWLFALGGMVDVARWAAAGQEQAQRALAGGLRAVRAGEPGAWLTLMSLCAAYGFFHAAGPGHGKLVIGGYGAAARVTARRLSALAVLSSLAQAVTAIAFVATGSWVLGLTRAQMTDTADRVLAPASYIAIALVGLWLLIRGVRKLAKLSHSDPMPALANMPAGAHVHAHVAAHDMDAVCSDCGHAHGPSVRQAEQATSLRDAAAIVGSVAVRPCTGAVFLLILCFALNIPWAGVAGALVMGLGTASVTVLVALAAVSARISLADGFTKSLSALSARRSMAMVEVIAGGMIALIATALALPLI
ncbi:MAG: hypothetical protein AAF601_10635 [Pseudomonadota bacterium]